MSRDIITLSSGNFFFFYQACDLQYGFNRYSNINLDAIQGLRRIDAEFDSYFGGHWHKNRVWIG